MCQKTESEVNSLVKDAVFLKIYTFRAEITQKVMLSVEVIYSLLGELNGILTCFILVQY